MLKELPFKKEYLLIAGTVILLLIGYRFAFEKTIEAWKLNSDLKEQLARSADISYQPQYLERKNNNLAKIIALYKADSVELRSNIINAVSSLAEKENVKLIEVPVQDPFYHTPQFIIQKLNFGGDYFSLIKTLNRLQATRAIGIVRSANLKVVSTQTAGTRATKLALEVFLEIKAEEK